MAVSLPNLERNGELAMRRDSQQAKPTARPPPAIPACPLLAAMRYAPIRAEGWLDATRKPVPCPHHGAGPRLDHRLASRCRPADSRSAQSRRLKQDPTRATTEPVCAGRAWVAALHVLARGQWARRVPAPPRDGRLGGCKRGAIHHASCRSPGLRKRRSAPWPTRARFGDRLSPGDDVAFASGPRAPPDKRGDQAARWRRKPRCGHSTCERPPPLEQRQRRGCSRKGTHTGKATRRPAEEIARRVDEQKSADRRVASPAWHTTTQLAPCVPARMAAPSGGLRPNEHERLSRRRTALGPRRRLAHAWCSCQPGPGSGRERSRWHSPSDTHGTGGGPAARNPT